MAVIHGRKGAGFLTGPSAGRSLQVYPSHVAVSPAGAESFVKRAIISDIHGNLEAFQAVLEDIDAHGVDSIICLGDIVGYGPNPCECIKLVRDRCGVVIMGNHDQGALIDPDGFNSGAERAIRWTR